MTNTGLHPRFLRRKLLEALRDTPVVLVHGPRQCGKTTLAKTLEEEAGYAYVSFDNDIQRAAAQSDPMAFVADLPDRCILDEVQRVPALFTSIKVNVDNDRRPGRFVLTGSANILTQPKIADSLAGRMEILRLHPLAQAELCNQRPTILDDLFTNKFKPRKAERLGKELARLIVAGGYPAALSRASGKRSAAWYRDYVKSLIVKDVQEYARISSLDTLPRLMEMASGHTASLLNIANLASPFELTRPTIKEYLILLESLFLLDRIPAWHRNRMSRLIKTPKLHIGDSGVGCALLGIDADALWEERKLLGQMLETFVFQELRKLSGWRDEPVRFSHFRNKDGVEVDLVLESGGQVVGVEVKASATISADDFKSLRKLRDAVGKSFTCGVVLYDGDTTVRFGDDLLAVPVTRLWD